MGFIRGGILFFVAIVVLVIFLLGNLLVTFNLSLNHDSVQNGIKPIITEAVLEKTSQQQLDVYFLVLQQTCYRNQTANLSYNLVSQRIGTGGELNLDCTTVLQSNSSNEFLDNYLTSVVDQYYYKEYNVNFFDVLFGRDQEQFFLVSNQAKQLARKYFYYLLLVFAIVVVLSFFLFEKKENMFLFYGILLFISSLPFARADLLLKLGNFDVQIVKIATLLFTKGTLIFIIDSVIVVLLVALAFALKVLITTEKISVRVEKSNEEKKEQRK